MKSQPDKQHHKKKKKTQLPQRNLSVPQSLSPTDAISHVLYCHFLYSLLSHSREIKTFFRNWSQTTGSVRLCIFIFQSPLNIQWIFNLSQPNLTGLAGVSSQDFTDKRGPQISTTERFLTGKKYVKIPRCIYIHINTTYDNTGQKKKKRKYIQ